MISVGKGNDTQYLLIALIVVIIGGMGSLGAPFSAPSRSVSSTRSATSISRRVTPTSPGPTIFGMLMLVLAVRPLGLFGRPA